MNIVRLCVALNESSKKWKFITRIRLFWIDFSFLFFFAAKEFRLEDSLRVGAFIISYSI